MVTNSPASEIWGGVFFLGALVLVVVFEQIYRSVAIAQGNARKPYAVAVFWISLILVGYLCGLVSTDIDGTAGFVIMAHLLVTLFRAASLSTESEHSYSPKDVLQKLRRELDARRQMYKEEHNVRR